MTAQYYIGLGSNIGNREAYLRTALTMLTADGMITLERQSSFYETPPWGITEQEAFINAVCRISTTLKPEDLLLKMQGVERALGRERHIHWGPRTIDLDILCYAENPVQTYASDPLTLPHPFFWDRAFVLQPLFEISPDFSFHNVSIRQRLTEIDGEGIRKIDENLT